MSRERVITEIIGQDGSYQAVAPLLLAGCGAKTGGLTEAFTVSGGV